VAKTESPSDFSPVTYVIRLHQKSAHRPHLDSMIFKQAGGPHLYAGMSVVRIGSVIEMIYHFADVSVLQRWLDSEEYSELLGELNDATDNIETERVEGNVYYASHKPAPPTPPPVYKRILVTWLAITPLLLVLLPILGRLLASMPAIPRTMLIAAVIVPLMVLFALPLLNRLFHAWLHPE